MRRRLVLLRGWAATAAVVVVFLTALVANAAAAGGTFTWTGATVSGNWSSGGDWVGGLPPSGSVDSLVFPAALTAGDCGNTSHTDQCRHGYDDLSTLATNAITIDDGVGYGLFDNQITVGAGGIDATTSSGNLAPALIETSVVLGAPQNWAIDGGPNGVGQLELDGGVTGGSALDAGVANAGTLELAIADNELGDLTITGANSADSGVNAYANGALELGLDTSVNVTSGGTLTLHDAALYGWGATGSVISHGGIITTGTPNELTIAGSLTLDAASVLQFPAYEWTTASHLRVTGNADLGGASLEITGAGQGNPCPVLSDGDVDTLMTTDGSLTGTFSGAANGAVVSLHCAAPNPPQVEIQYAAQAVTATVVYAGPVPVNTGAPTIDGLPELGRYLDESQGSWTNSTSSPLTYTYQWYDCNTVGADCVGIPGASQESYLPQASDCGHTIVVDETAANDTGPGTASASVPTAIVALGCPPPTASTTTTPASNGVQPELVGVHVKDDKAEVTLRCLGSPPNTCVIDLRATVTEHGKSNKHAGLGRPAHGVVARGRPISSNQRTVVVGSAHAVIIAGERATVGVGLNAAGRNLLKTKHRLSVNLRAVSGGASVAAETITFEATTSQKHHSSAHKP